MTDTTTTEKRTVYIVETDHSDYAARGETLVGAVAAYRKGIRDANRGIELLRKRDVPEAEIRDIWPDGVLQLPIKAIRREHTEVVTTPKRGLRRHPGRLSTVRHHRKDQQ